MFSMPIRFICFSWNSNDLSYWLYLFSVQQSAFKLFIFLLHQFFGLGRDIGIGWFWLIRRHYPNAIKVAVFLNQFIPYTLGKCWKFRLLMKWIPVELTGFKLILHFQMPQWPIAGCWVALFDLDFRYLLRGGVWYASWRLLGWFHVAAR